MGFSISLFPSIPPRPNLVNINIHHTVRHVEGFVARHNLGHHYWARHHP